MKPLFIWAGGKTKVIKHYLPFMPTQIDTYYEPFFGGGAMFVYVMNNYKPRNIFINDINKNVMAIYESIRDEYDTFIERVNHLEAQYIPLSKDDRKKYYYNIRHNHAWDYEQWNKTFEAATLYFLMKTGFNGIYQLNKNTNNRYGTPSGLLNQKEQIYNRDVLKWWNNALQNVTITSTDWRDSVSSNSEAFYFFDPPYRDSFTNYGNNFSDESLEELVSFCSQQSKVFCANRADDDWFDNLTHNMDIHYFDITYTAGRRRKEGDTFSAKKAREILLYKTDRVCIT